MEFGSPHLVVREPIQASAEASAKVANNLSRRRVFIVGDWHLWIQEADWEIRTKNYQASTQDREFVQLGHALDEIDGQILQSAAAGDTLNSLVLQFDLGGYLGITPCPKSDEDLCSMRTYDGRLFTCAKNGELTLDEERL